MVKINWVTHSDVGDQSMYVHDICMICESIVILCKSILSSDYFGSFCNSFATMFLPLFVSSIHRCKRIGEMGAQQLLLDTHGIKTLFLKYFYFKWVRIKQQIDGITSTLTHFLNLVLLDFFDQCRASDTEQFRGPADIT